MPSEFSFEDLYPYLDSHDINFDDYDTQMRRLYEMFYRSGVKPEKNIVKEEDHNDPRDVEIERLKKLALKFRDERDNFEEAYERARNKHKEDELLIKRTNECLKATEAWEIFDFIDCRFREEEIRKNIMRDVESFLEFENMKLLEKIPKEFGLQHSVLMIRYREAVSKEK